MKQSASVLSVCLLSVLMEHQDTFLVAISVHNRYQKCCSPALEKLEKNLKINFFY